PILTIMIMATRMSTSIITVKKTFTSTRMTATFITMRKTMTMKMATSTTTTTTMNTTTNTGIRTAGGTMPTIPQSRAKRLRCGNCCF
ncbi:MAG: hypothetical protein ACYDFU_04085, partial [Nitrospirota bacterium]